MTHLNYAFHSGIDGIGVKPFETTLGTLAISCLQLNISFLRGAPESFEALSPRFPGCFDPRLCCLLGTHFLTISYFFSSKFEEGSS